jgi:hypothetical protein
MMPEVNSGAEAVGNVTGLSGPGYVRNNWVTATHDDDVAGRWVAADESGWDGEQLYARADRYLVIGSVAIDDESAATIVEQIRRDAALSQPPELKFNQFGGRRGDKRLEVLVALLGPQVHLPTEPTSIWLTNIIS